MRDKNDLIARLLIGGAFVAIGLFIVAIGTGVIPSDPRSFHAPKWLIALIGFAFAFAGGSLLLGAAAPHAEADGALPATAPLLLRVVQFLFGLFVVAALAITGIWAAFDDGPGKIKASVGGFGFSASWISSETVGRTMFGIGAAFCVVIFVAVARRGWRRFTRT